MYYFYETSGIATEVRFPVVGYGSSQLKRVNMIKKQKLQIMARDL